MKNPPVERKTPIDKNQILLVLHVDLAFGFVFTHDIAIQNNILILLLGTDEPLFHLIENLVLRPPRQLEFPAEHHFTVYFRNGSGQIIVLRLFLREGLALFFVIGPPGFGERQHTQCRATNPS